MKSQYNILACCPVLAPNVVTHLEWPLLARLIKAISESKLLKTLGVFGLWLHELDACASLIILIHLWTVIVKWGPAPWHNWAVSEFDIMSATWFRQPRVLHQFRLSWKQPWPLCKRTSSRGYVSFCMATCGLTVHIISVERDAGAT